MPRSLSAKREPRLGVRRVPRDGELGPTDLLAAEQIAHRLNRLELEVEIGFKVEFHGVYLKMG